ncbi:MAG: GntR family transcriptional regulator [Burkholderiales bacterium]|nr:GntR family transcriptional regulator [Burkholderiales bacterium]
MSIPRGEGDRGSLPLTPPSHERRRQRSVRRDHVASDFVPRYYQVYSVLRQRVQDGEWSVDTAMPTEENFAAAFNVSRVTIRKALNMLEQEKLILRQQGRGTFALTPPRRRDPANFSGLVENIADFESRTKVRLLAFGRVTLPDEAAQLLECAPGSRALRIVRVRSDSREPFSYTTCYVPEPEADLLTEASLGNRTVNHALETAGVVALAAEQRLSAAIAGIEVAGLLRVDVGAPLISMTRVMRDVSGRPVEALHALYRTDKYEYRVNLSRERGGDAPRWTVKDV